MRGVSVHVVTEVDTVELTGICANCGPVEVYQKIVGKGRYPMWQCRVKRREDKAKYDNLRFVKRRRELLALQNNECAICSSPVLVNDHLDHDHACCSRLKDSCGECLRGILCRGCNIGLGNFKDNVETLQAAIRYLEGLGRG